MAELLQSILYGITEGITEWLPISSTGHLLLLKHFLTFPFSDEFYSFFLVCVQLFAVLAIPVAFRKKLFLKDSCGDRLAFKPRFLISVFLGILPACIIGFFADDLISTYFSVPIVIAFALILYGILFILQEKKQKADIILSAEEIPAKTAFRIGLYQALALIPGTSRSGATVYGARKLGTERRAATEYSFYLALPIMFCASVYRGISYIIYGDGFTLSELSFLLIGGAVAFLVSLFSIRFLLSFSEKHGFTAFGIYRIIFGAIILILNVFQVI